MDNHTPEQRRKNMQAVKNKDSKIELLCAGSFGLEESDTEKTPQKYSDILILPL